jgi:hypothetical protein
MSLSRVGEYLQELESRTEFSLTLEGAPRDGEFPPSAATLNRRPVFSALQQANTSQIGQTIPVQLKKGVICITCICGEGMNDRIR